MDGNNNAIISLLDARKLLINKKAIFIITNEENTIEYGYLYYVSENETTYDKMMKEFARVKEKGFRAIIMGSYDNGDIISVRYNLC